MNIPRIRIDSATAQRMDADAAAIRRDTDSGTNLSPFFARALEFVESELRLVEYADLASWTHIPKSSKWGDALFGTWRLFDRVGKWRFISRNADDVPAVDIFGAELTTPIRMVGGGYRYTLQELLASQAASMLRPNDPSIQIDTQRAKANFEAYRQIMDEIAWFADPSKGAYEGLTGVFYNPYIPQLAAAAGKTNSNTHVRWFDNVGTGNSGWKDPADIYNDVGALLDLVFTQSKGLYRPDTILFPIKHYTMLNRTMYSANYPLKTIMRFLVENYPWVNTWDYYIPGNNVPAGGGGITTASDVIWAFKSDTDCLKSEMPRMFSQLAVQQKGFNYIVPSWATSAGIIIYKPLSMAFLTGTSANGIGDGT